jgi:hypothetical protein
MQGLTSITCTATFQEGDIITSSPIDVYNPITFTITGLFKYQGYTRVGEHFNLICDGLQNPKTTEPTSSFSLNFYDRYGCGNERVNTGVILYMFGLPSFKSVKVESDVQQNGQIANIEVKIIATVIMADGYSFYITFPPEIPLPSTPNCINGILTSTVNCWTLPENELKITLYFTAPPVLETVEFSFKVVGLKNPIST